jgi:hypothetical protein
LIKPALIFEIGIAVGLVLIYPREKWKIISMASVLVWVFSSKLRWGLLGKALALDGFRFDKITLLSAKIVSLAIVLTLVFLLFRLARRFKLIQSQSVLFVFSLLCALNFIVTFMQPVGLLKYCFLGVILLFTNFIWFIVVNLSESRSLGHSFWQTIGTFRPFWSDRFFSAPGTIDEFDRRYCQNRDDRIICQLRGLRLIIWTLVLFFGKRAINAFIFLNHEEMSFLHDGFFSSYGMKKFEFFLNFEGSKWQLWFYVFARTGEILLDIAVKFGILVSSLRIMGFYLFRHVWRPLESKSFLDFFGRIMYYYKRFILRTFFIPFYKNLSFIAHQEVKVTLTAFLTVFVGGSLYHSTKILIPNLTGSVEAVFKIFAKQVPYFFILATFVSVGVFLNRRYPTKGRSKAHSFTMSLLYFSVLTFLYSFAIYSRFVEVDLDHFLGFLKRLFWG